MILLARNVLRRKTLNLHFVAINKYKSQARTNLFVDSLESAFVPSSERACKEDVDRLQEFVNDQRRLFVLTGAGISTESGIPDYRSEGVGLYARSSNRPVNNQDFLKHEKTRQRYWARNYAGWPRFSSFLPNICHVTLSQWEKLGKIHWLVTQNVDALHMKAGSQRLTELHGSSHRVFCVSCGNRILRTELQELIEVCNPSWREESIDLAPDGDVALTEEQVGEFKVPPCQKCGGILKPEITFFGDNVAKGTVKMIFDRLMESDGMLVVGSSLQVYSAYRFVLRARDEKIPIAVLNIGPTRADPVIDLKISAKCSEVLRQMVIS